MKHSIIPVLLIAASLTTSHAQWKSINPGAGGQVQDVVADPGTIGTLYLASDMEGVYKSTDNGESWHITGKLMHNRVYSVTVDPGNSDKLYIGTLYGLHRSTDGGTTYQFIQTTKGWSIGSIAVDPTNSNRIIAGPGWRDDYDFIGTLGESQTGSGELFLSEDGGVNWTKKTFDTNTASDRNIWSICYNPTNSDIVYIGSSKGIYKSMDGGNQWVKLPNPNGGNSNRGISLSSDGNVLYAAYDSPGSLYATPTAAIAWQPVMAGNGIALSILNYWYPEVDPRSGGSTHSVLVGLQGQRDGLFEGTFNWSGNTLSSYTWKKIWSGNSTYDRGWDYADPNARFAHYTPATWTRAVWSTTNQTIYEGLPDGSVYTWHNKYCIPNPAFSVPAFGKYWPTYSSRGTESTYSYDIAVHNNYVLQGQGDNGLMESWDYGFSWSNMQHRLNSGINLSDVQAVDIADAWGTPMAIAQATSGYGGNALDGRFYVKPLVNHSPEDTWTLLGAGPDKLLNIENGVLRDIAVSPANPAKVFLFSTGYGMYMIEDIGRSVSSLAIGKPVNARKISNGVADATTSAKKIAPHPTNEDVVFYYASSGNTGVYKGVNTNNTWSWSKIYNGYGWDSEVHAWEHEGQVYLMYEGFATGAQGDGNHAIVALSLDEGETWNIVFNKEKAMALITPDWYNEWKEVYIFHTKGGPAGYGNTLVVNYYHHGFQLGYGLFKGTIQPNADIVWEDWTGDLHFPGPTSGLFAETDQGLNYYTTTAGAGAWMREIGPKSDLPALPLAPEMVSAEPLTSKTINVSWSDLADNETGYRIERKSGAGEFETIGQVGRNKNSYVDFELQHSTNYTYRIVAFNKGGISAYSDLTMATTLEGNGIPCQNPNLIANGDFEANLNGWLFYTNAGAIATTSAVNEEGFSGSLACKTVITQVTGNENDIQLYKPFSGLTGNTTYQVTFKAKSSLAKSIRMGILLDHSPWTGFLNETIALSTELQDYGPFNFYMPEDNDQVRIDFFLGANAMNLWMDDITITSTTPCIAYQVDSIKVLNCLGNLDIGDTYSLVYQAYPEDVEFPRVKWSTSDENILTVTSNGFLKALSKGTATIKLEALDGGLPDSCIIQVNMLVEGITIDNCPTAKLKPGDTYQLLTTIIPEEASNKAVIWTSSNNSVATVSSEGVVTAIGVGSTSIKVETVSQGKSKRCTIGVDLGSGVDNLSASAIQIFPNPIRLGNDLKLMLPDSRATELELIDITGNSLYKAILSADGDQPLMIAGKHFMHKGLYVLKIKRNDSVQGFKIIVK
jgi:uncharacterized protein YjdB